MSCFAGELNCVRCHGGFLRLCMSRRVHLGYFDGKQEVQIQALVSISSFEAHCLNWFLPWPVVCLFVCFFLSFFLSLFLCFFVVSLFLCFFVSFFVCLFVGLAWLGLVCAHG